MPDLRAKVVLMDIEGTTTSISFVKDVLFPYAKQHTREYLAEHWEQEATKELVTDLLQLPQYKEYLTANKIASSISADGVANFVNYLIDKDVKLGPLKILQGYVWAKGYETGALKGHVYADVPDTLKRWQQEGLTLAIYSSGSVNAQKLLFGSSAYGDLLPYISAHFDTQVGYKQEAQSYVNIAKELKVECADVLFLTDIVGEAAAARAAGMEAILLSRKGNAPLTDDDKAAYTVIDSFESLTFAGSQVNSNNKSIHN